MPATPLKCSRAHRCAAPPDVTLEPRHFQRDPTAYSTRALLKTCSFCRSSDSNRAAQKRRARPPASPTAGLTPGTRRSRNPPPRPASPSPRRPQPPPLSRIERPTRNRNPPVRPYDTPPTPSPSTPPPPVPPRPPPTRRKCTDCKALLPFADFQDAQGIAVNRTCAACRARRRERYHLARAAGNMRSAHSEPPDSPPPAHTTAASPNRSSSHDAPDISLPRASAPHGTPQPNATALSTESINIITRFHDQLDAIGMLECPECHERWFDINLSKGVCQHCHAAAQSAPGRWSASNNMDPGERSASEASRMRSDCRA